jgi:Rod binding domain-containing protein
MEEMMLQNVIDKTRIQANQARAKVAKAQQAQPSGHSHAEIEKAAQDFEAVFLSQMLQHMFKGVDPSPMTDGAGEEIYQSMLVDEYGKILAQAGGVGVADHVKREMLKMQESR